MTATTSNTALTLNVSTQGIVRTLVDQFSSSTTFIKELAQNARRAGATQVDISYDREAGVMVIADDGRGIDSLESILTIGQSGWNNLEMAAEENPFGIGFASAIFASKSILVETTGWAVDIDTADLLNFKPVKMLTSDRSSGTSITLYLTEDTAKQLSDSAFMAIGSLHRTFAGFPIPVIVNGEEMLREDVDDDAFESFACGRFRSDFRPVNGLASARVYLQGMCIFDDEGSTYHHGTYHKTPAFVVHLDPRKFRARVPDRDALIDEVSVIKALRKELEKLWLAELTTKKIQMTDDGFATVYWNIFCKLDAPELSSDLPIPKGNWGVYETPLKFGRWDGAQEEMLKPQEQALRKTGLTLKHLSYSDEADSAMSLYAFKMGWPVITKQTPKGHWSGGSTLCPEDMAYTVKPDGEIQTIEFESIHGWGMKILLYESFSVSVSSDDKITFPDLVVDDEPVFCTTSRTFVLPRKSAEANGGIENLLLLAGSYEEEFDMDEDALERDIDSLKDIVALALGGTPEETIKRLLLVRTHFLRHQLAGKSFLIEFDDSGDAKVS